MGNINQNNAPIDAAAAMAAEVAAARGGGGAKKSAFGKSTKGMVVKQKDIPTARDGVLNSGRVTFRILPPMADMQMPWVRFDEHFFFNEGNREWAAFNCFWRHSNGAEQCEGCDFIRRLNDQINWPMEKMSADEQKAYLVRNPHFRGAKKMAGSKAKTTIAMNVIFTSWEGGPVPEKFAGVRVLQVGSGIWRGTTKNQIGGLLGILQEHPKLADAYDGPEICIVKSGVDLDTTYPVSVVMTKERVEIRGKIQEVDVPNMTPIASTPEEIEALLKERAGLGIFLRMRTHDEVAESIAKVDTFTVPMGTARPVQRPTAPAQRTAQEELSTEFGGESSDTDEIPF